MIRKLIPLIAIVLLLGSIIPAKADGSGRPIWLHALCGGYYEVDTRGYGVQGFFTLEALYVRDGKTHLDKIQSAATDYIYIPGATRISASINGQNESILKVDVGPSCPPYEPIQFDTCQYKWQGDKITSLYWKVTRNTNPFPVRVNISGLGFVVPPLFSRYWGTGDDGSVKGLAIESLDGTLLRSEPYVPEWRTCNPAELY